MLVCGTLSVSEWHVMFRFKQVGVSVLLWVSRGTGTPVYWTKVLLLMQASHRPPYEEVPKLICDRLIINKRNPG